jgi:hypothetical protein
MSGDVLQCLQVRSGAAKACDLDGQERFRAIPCLNKETSSSRETNEVLAVLLRRTAEAEIVFEDGCFAMLSECMGSLKKRVYMQMGASTIHLKIEKKFESLKTLSLSEMIMGRA